jgi:hypothetical protein
MGSLWPIPALVLLAVTPPTGADSVEASVVVSCANPVCARQFHALSQGRLYLLPLPGCAFSRLADHCYWLCAKCSLHFALIRHEGEVVLLVRERNLMTPVQLLMSGRWDRTSP